jgi:hypothetical protein
MFGELRQKITREFTGKSLLRKENKQLRQILTDVCDGEMGFRNVQDVRTFVETSLQNVNYGR